MLCAALAWHAAPLAAQAPVGPHAPAWAQAGGVCYEIFVRSFADSDGDGTGDLNGLTARLDYVNDGDPATDDDLGATCIWLMPIAESPSYHGYDVVNYYEINRDYGTNADFKRFMAEAHRRGIRVLFDLVLNHTSSEHPYFRDAVLYRDSPYRSWYRFSPTRLPSPGWQAETWHPVPGRDEFYYGLFWSGMPDLNLADPEVKAETRRIARFWLDEMGVDGFRLDAVGHLFEEPDGTWRNASGNFPWLRDFAADVRRMKPDAFTVGEAYDSIGGVLPYYPDQLDAMFMFGISDALIDAVRSGSKTQLVAAVERVQRDVPAGRAAIFLSNHDRTRIMNELGGDVARSRVAATLLLTLPGIPFVYYGEEIGMTGDKHDGDVRLRTPMHWERRKGLGFTTGVPWEPAAPDSMTANVQAQDGVDGSLLETYRRLIHVRSEEAALGAGDFVAVETGSDAAVAYLRRVAGRPAVLVVTNLGETPLRGVRLVAPRGALPAGRYTARSLVGGGSATQVTVGRDGRIPGWSELAPLTGYVIELSGR